MKETIVILKRNENDVMMVEVWDEQKNLYAILHGDLFGIELMDRLDEGYEVKVEIKEVN